MTATEHPTDSLFDQFKIDNELLSAALQGTMSGLSMSGIEPAPVGVSRMHNPRHATTIVVGLVGQHSGAMALNFSDEAILHIAGQLLGETPTSVNADTVDAILEIGNMVAGGVRDILEPSRFKVAQLSLPSIVRGQSYSMVYARGATEVSVDFELPDMPLSQQTEWTFSTTISLLAMPT